MTLTFDHIAISAVTLDAGVAAVEAALGVKLANGGNHPHMATHNRLLALGDIYLEVIAIDPSAANPPYPRWFDLDRFTGPPALTNWVARTDDLAAALRQSPAGTGIPIALSRGPYHWQMAVPADGKLPFDGAFPALIQWQPPHHPTQNLPESHIRLQSLDITHPLAGALKAALILQDPRIHISQGPRKSIRASFTTPNGIRHFP